MKAYIFISLCFLTQTLVGQTPYRINYSIPTTLKINSEYNDQKEEFYDVEFLNEKYQKIKSMRRNKVIHSSKIGYEINNTIIYYFYKDTLLIEEIIIDPDYRKIYKTEYTYNDSTKELGWANYSSKLKISRDSFYSIVEKDLLLNNPSLFPTKDLTLETKEVKKYENNKLIYKCYYERFGKLKIAIPAREQYFKYNEKGQLVEHISNPKSDAGGTAFLRRTFEYNDKSQVAAEQSYSDGKHGWTIEYEYHDNSIIKTFYSLDDNGNKHYYYRSGIKEPDSFKRVYTKGEDGKFYDEHGSKFSLAGEGE